MCLPSLVFLSGSSWKRQNQKRIWVELRALPGQAAVIFCMVERRDSPVWTHILMAECCSRRHSIETKERSTKITDIAIADTLHWRDLSVSFTARQRSKLDPKLDLNLPQTCLNHWSIIPRTHLPRCFAITKKKEN